MKKILTTLALVAVVASSFGQGQVKLSNQSPQFIVENGVGNMPVRTTGNFNTYFLAALLMNVGPGNSMVPVFYSTNSATLSGLISSGSSTPLAAPVTAGTTYNFQIAVWQYALGNNGAGGPDYASFVGNVDFTDATAPRVNTSALQGLWTGYSAIGSVTPNVVAGPTAAPALWGAAAGQLPGMTLYQTAVVPEPATFALAGLGIAAMLVSRRRK